MINLIFPIFVVEGNDVIIFLSLKDVQTQLEAVDIRDNIYTSYDAEGRRLKLESDGNRTKVILSEEKPTCAVELETSLRQYLMTMNEYMAKEMSCDLPCLVNLSVKYAVKTNFKMHVIDLWRRLFGKRKRQAELNVKK